MRVLITNGQNRIAYAALRSLGCRGISVCAADFIPWAMCFSSRYCQGHFRYPSPFRKPQECINSLIENGRRQNCRILLPIYEETFLIAKYQDKLKSHFSLAVPEYEKMLMVHDKKRLYELAQRLEIPTPRFAALSAPHPSHYPWLEEARYPLWLKPRQGGGAWAVVPMASFEELLRRWTRPDLPYGLPPDRFLVQEHVPGPIFCVAMLFCRGKLRARFTYRQVRNYPLRGGVATLRVSDRHQGAESSLQRLLEALEWHGVCQADFAIDQESGLAYLLDVNPRFWSATHLAVICGVDFPYLVYQLAAFGDIEPALEHPIGIQSRWFWGELRAFWEAFRQPGERIKALKTYSRIRGADSHFDDLCLKDPLPPLIFFIDSLRRMLKQRSLTLRPHDSLDGVWE
ncbi:MAG: ATP-grasp domain-containing protein [bacterium]|nr:ATP-grasp domain-containing protein [bacterium]